jgi:hypothetical protein
MSALGHKRTCAVQKGMSALPPKAGGRLCVAALRQCASQSGRVAEPAFSLAAMIARHFRVHRVRELSFIERRAPA